MDPNNFRILIFVDRICFMSTKYGFSLLYCLFYCLGECMPVLIRIVTADGTVNTGYSEVLRHGNAVS